MVPIKTPVIVSKNNYEPLDEPLDEAPPISPSTNEDDSNEVDDFAEMEKMLGLGDGDDELEGASDLVPASSSFPPPLGKVVPPQLRMRQDAPKLPCEATPPKEEYVRDDVGDDGDDWGYDDEEVQEAEPVNYDYFGADGRANGEQDDDMDSYASETNYARSSYSTRHMPEAKRQPAHPPAMTTMSSSLVQSVFAPPKPPPSKTVNMSTFSSSTLPTTTVHQLKAREAEAESKLASATKMMNEARRIQASLESQSSLLREMKERVKRECDEQRDECKKYADGERKKLDKERGRLANERIKVSKLSASMSGGGDGDFARANTNANVDDSDGLGGWTHKALRQEVVGLKGTIVDLKRQVEAWKTKYKSERTRLNNQLQSDRESYRASMEESKALKARAAGVEKEATSAKESERKKWQSRVWRAEEEGRKWKRRFEELGGDCELVFFKPDEKEEKRMGKGKGKGKKAMAKEKEAATEDLVVVEEVKVEGVQIEEEQEEQEEEMRRVLAERELRRLGEIRDRELEMEMEREMRERTSKEFNEIEAPKVYRAEEYGGDKGDEGGLSDVVTSKTTASDGRVDTTFAGGRTMTEYPNGTHKETQVNGSSAVRFVNGDVKSTGADGVVVYYYHTAQTYHTSYPDGVQVFEFIASQQIEHHYPDGRKEIVYGDGTKKKIEGDGREESVFKDGVVVRREGGREVVSKII